MKEQLLLRWPTHPPFDGHEQSFLHDGLKKTKKLPDLEQTLAPYQEGDVLELDEVWSFVRGMEFRETTQEQATAPQALDLAGSVP